jgi:ribosomal protein S18 acetylase RimI-like enzyme
LPRARPSGSSPSARARPSATRVAGIGTRLLDAVDDELATRGVHDLRISVLAGNERAQRLYERRGFGVGELVLFRFGAP